MYDQSFYVSTFIYSIYCILTGNTDASTWPVGFESSLPFDTKTICGWYLQLLITASMDFAYIIWMLLGTAQFIGSCIYISAMCEHFDSIMQKVQANIKQNRGEKNPRKFSGIRAKIYTKIREAIEIHGAIYEYVNVVFCLV